MPSAHPLGLWEFRARLSWPFRKDDKLHTTDQTPAALSADGLDFISLFQVLLWSYTSKILKTRRELCVYLRKERDKPWARPLSTYSFESQPGKRIEQRGRKTFGRLLSKDQGNRVTPRGQAICK